MTWARRGVAALAVAVLGCGLPDLAWAQCGGPASTCRDCHENRALGPFVAAEPWHRDHALADFCSDCHGGSPTMADDSAHAGLADPLANDGERCRLCHADRARIFERYLSLRELASAPGLPATSTHPRPPALPTGAPRGGARLEPRWSRNASCASAIVVLGLAAAAYVFARERGAAVLRTRLRGAFRRSEWSAYASGALLGVVVTLSMAGFGRRLSGSGAYQELAGLLARRAFPGSVYWTQVIRPGEYWNSVVLLGAILGASVAARLGGRFRVRSMPDAQWADVFGASVGKRWLIAGMGSALTALGAGIAGGCTASLALSGGAALSPGAFAFMAGMFSAGIPTAWFIYRKRSQ